MSSLGKNEEYTNESSNSEDGNKKEDHNISTSTISDISKTDEFINPDFEILPKDFAEPDHIYKIIIIGDSGVGKTSLTYRISTGKFHQIDIPTLGFEFCPILVKYKDKIIRLELWDTCGQEAYRSLIKSFFINSTLAIMVYSIDSKKSFNSIPEWIRQCRNFCSISTRYILIGNKNDLKK